MTPSAVAVLLLTCGGIITDASLFELSRMIKDVTRRNAIPDYSTYGCYCGLGGKGKPLDKTDWCCQQHDCCYTKVDKEGCKSKTNLYIYSYNSGKVRCGAEPLWWKLMMKNGIWCQRKVCECDRRFVECLKKYSRSYQNAYRYHSNELCYGSSPHCKS
ncbi:basic phospholipase A2 F16-like [Elgaria multicarinata webbii]|uniref:basic phospholipase A2 F16-like n=1 Tax=Elgaria multicarinata webbii TaxID=159646 RepID=UPI002FCD5D42